MRQVVVASLLAFIILCVACTGNVRQQNSELSVKKADLSALIEENHKNPVAMLDKYNGSQVEFSGYIKRVGSALGTYLEVSPKENPGITDPDVQVYLDDNMVSILKKYPIGSKIILRVVFEGDPNNNRLTGRCAKIVDN